MLHCLGHRSVSRGVKPGVVFVLFLLGEQYKERCCFNPGTEMSESFD